MLLGHLFTSLSLPAQLHQHLAVNLPFFAARLLVLGGNFGLGLDCIMAEWTHVSTFALAPFLPIVALSFWSRLPFYLPVPFSLPTTDVGGGGGSVKKCARVPFAALSLAPKGKALILAPSLGLAGSNAASRPSVCEPTVVAAGTAELGEGKAYAGVTALVC